MSKQEYIQRLFTKYLEDEASPEEIRLLMQQAELPHNEDLLIELMNNVPVSEEATGTPADHQHAVKEVIGRLMKEIDQPEDHAGGQGRTSRIAYMKRGWFRYSAAAAIIILVVSGAYFLLFPTTPKEKLARHSPAKAEKVEPGRDGAILTLSDGSTLVLDSLGNGIIATQNNTRLALNNGQLSYEAGAPAAGEAVYNTLTTPRGRQFHLVLEDGTLVWLNSASTLRYPVVFDGKERKVEITGEVYFEVAKDKNRKFMVQAGNTTTEVLGTRFNINAYDDEPSIKTTLLEGSVLISAGGAQSVVLKPGQQASCTGQQPGIRVQAVNTEEVIAWKNGIFNFNNADIKTVMRSLARWYDLEVIYEGTPSPAKFKGKIQRNLELTDVLDFLKNDIRFEREGNKIIIKK